MSEQAMHRGIILENIRLGLNTSPDEVINIAKSRMKKTGIPLSSLSYRLHRRSVDARHRDRVCMVCSVIVESTTGQDLSKLSPALLTKLEAKSWVEQELHLVERGATAMRARPLIVGMGPAGLFCALFLAEQGYRPILIDRG
ncbi:MAG: FAD-dependent monooxygenase, partial [Clostridia bacterium]|nr:FAD-dependent monooxygenase [Clostridia bacterium]